MNRLQVVADQQARYGVKRLCRILNFARSWKAPASDRAACDAAAAALGGRIRVVHGRHDSFYRSRGSPPSCMRKGSGSTARKWLG